MSVHFTDFGFGLCLVAFGALAISLRPDAVAGGMPSTRLRVAALFMAAWAVVAAVAARSTLVDPALALFVSLVTVAVWNWQLVPLASWLQRAGVLNRLLQWGGIVVLVLSLGWMLAAARSPAIPAPTAGMLALPGLAMAVLGLFTLEQLYRLVPDEVQPAMRWLALGMGGVLLGELMVFAETLVLGQLIAAPGALRATAYALCALAIIHGARRMPRWVVGLSISRQCAFYAGSFLLIGGYLVLMGMVGWVLLRYAQGWNAVASAVFAAAAALGLGLSLFSAGLFRRLRVLISTHFYAQRYDYRVEWMRFARTMSEHDAQGVPQRSIRALAQIIGSPAGTLWRRTGNEGDFHCSQGWPEGPGDITPMAAGDALPAYLQRTAWLVDLAELATRPGLYGDLRLDAKALQAAPDALIVPLLHLDLLHGWIVLERAPGQGNLDFEDRDLLKIAGRHVAAHLAQLDADTQLTEARQFETYSRMTAFVMHDLKNIAAQLKLLSQNAERHRRNPEFVDDAFRTVAAAAARMSRLIAQLTTGRESGTLQTVDLATCAERALQRCGGLPQPQLVVDARPAIFADPEQLASIIEHAVRNAQDATPPDGSVRVEVGVRGRRPALTVVDTGTGMDARFVRERLFRPFDTTKGSRGMGIGAFQIREYVRSLGGEVEVHSEPGAGTRLSMVFADRSILALAREAG